MAITVKQRGKAPVTIDREAEMEIIERAFEGLEHITLQTPGLNDRTDGIVAMPDLSHFVVEVKDRTYDYAYIAALGPLVDTSKAAAVAEKAAEQGGRGIIIWRTRDGFLIGAEAEDILVYGDVDPNYQRLKGNRPQDKPKSASVLPMEYCYVRPPASYKPGRLEQSWLRWLASADEREEES